jgi:hypothetical protein
MAKPNCYTCKYRRDIPGNCHSMCAVPPGVGAKVKGDDYGRESGWFYWPLNFDPIWLEECNMHTPKEVK